MEYNWDGDVIVQDSVVDRKRYVIGCKEPISTDIREFVSPADDAIIKGVLRELAEKKGLPDTKKPADFDRRALIIWDHVAQFDRQGLQGSGNGPFQRGLHLFPLAGHLSSQRQARLCPEDCLG
jgi:hypothetical protein